MATASTRKTRGRQKVAMVRMQKESNRLVTFSKRRSGLFKKASELCTLCGAEAAVIVFSPGNKAYSFGHPSVELITDRFLYRDSTQFYPYHDNRHAHEILQDDRLLTSNKEVSDLKDKMDLERKRTEELLKARKSKNPEILKFLAPVEELTLPELKQIQASLLMLRSMVYQYQQNMFDAHSIQNPNQNTNSLSLLGQNLMLGAQNYDPNFFLTQTGAPQTFEDPSQMMMMMRGPHDNPQVMMIPTPMRPFDDDPLLAMRSNLMNTRFMTPNIQPYQGQFDINETMLPFQETNNPIPGQYDIRQTMPPFQVTTDPIHTRFDIHQNMSTDMGLGRDPVPSSQQSLTSLLMGNGNPTNPPPPFNHQGGFGFDPRMN
ncbi:hypothetical protein RND81_09G158700 [Saponaria officinalis]|uniref:MADS-box domain-containing protein n=1 Tax=Saponaria officinalis TaxID=3572 RepID=A0AAW1IND0_SAPOF